MEPPDLSRVARDIIGTLPAFMAITVDRHGETNARVVIPKPLSDPGTIRFATGLRSRTSQEIERSSRLTPAYQYDPDAACVTLAGHAVIHDDAATRGDRWRVNRRQPEFRPLIRAPALRFE